MLCLIICICSMWRCEMGWVILANMSAKLPWHTHTHTHTHVLDCLLACTVRCWCAHNTGHSDVLKSNWYSSCNSVCFFVCFFVQRHNEWSTFKSNWVVFMSCYCSRSSSSNNSNGWVQQFSFNSTSSHILHLNRRCCCCCCFFFKFKYSTLVFHHQNDTLKTF